MSKVRFENLSLEAKTALERAASIADERDHAVLTCEHLLLALVRMTDGNAAAIFSDKLGVDPTGPRLALELTVSNSLREVLPEVNRQRRSEFSLPLGWRDVPVSVALLRTFERARDEAGKDGEAIGSDYLLLSLASVDSSAQELLAACGLGKDWAVRELRVWREGPREREQQALDSLIDLGSLIKRGQLPRHYLRLELLRRADQVMRRSGRNSLLLIGEPGTGRSSLFRSWVEQIFPGEAEEMPRVLEIKPEALFGNVGAVIAKALETVGADAKRIILFIPQFASVWDDKAAKQVLQQAVARGQIQCVGAVTQPDYNRISSDPAIARYFGSLPVEPTSKEETLAILELHAPRLAEEYGVIVVPESFPYVAELGGQMGPNPGAAILLLDTACAQVRSIETLAEALRPAEIRADRQVDPDDVIAVASQATAIPLAGMPLSDGEREKLLKMEEILHRQVIGQNAAVSQVSGAYRRARAGLKDPKRPIGTFIFLGPTGVGKTLLGKKLAEFLFEDEERIIRLDMSEYSERHTVARMIGAPPGYVGYESSGQLTEAVRRQPFSVVLFDEIEKAHPEVWNILLQILDEGRLTDGHGRTVSFRNCIIIMTSNVGTHRIPVRYEDDDHRREVQSRVEEELRATFRPEFLNRLDGIVIFDHLAEDELLEIMGLELKKAIARVENTWHVAITIGDGVRRWLLDRREEVELGFGARPLKRIIQKHFEDPLARALIAQSIAAGDGLGIELGGKELEFRKEESNSRGE